MFFVSFHPLQSRNIFFSDSRNASQKKKYTYIYIYIRSLLDFYIRVKAKPTYRNSHKEYYSSHHTRTNVKE